MILRTIRHPLGLFLLVMGLKSSLLHAAPPAKDFVPQALLDAVAEGNAAYEKKDYAVARKAYERVLKLDGSNLMGLVNLGMVESALGNKAKAEETLKKAISLRLETAPAWLALGMMYMDEDRSDAALAALSPARIAWGVDEAHFGFNRRENPEKDVVALRAALNGTGVTLTPRPRPESAFVETVA